MGAEAVKSILVLHGPNLNMLGLREPQHYGSKTLEDIDQSLLQQADAAGMQLQSFQSNSEAELIARLHALPGTATDFIIINPAAFTHTSVALRDALATVNIPFVEVHISNVYAREPFRHHSYFTDIAVGVISGLGPKGYSLALEYAIERLSAS